MSAQRRLALAVAIISGFIASFMSTALNLSATSVGAEFDVSGSTSTRIVNACTPATAAFSICMGHYADAHGWRRMILAGMGPYGRRPLVCMCAPTTHERK